jgi:hypothetical protein
MPQNSQQGQQKGGQKRQQKGGVAGVKVQGSERTLANGATGASFRVTKQDGSQGTVFRFIDSTEAAAANARAARSNPRAISGAQAAQAFERYYRRNRAVKRGPRKGEPRWKSPRGRKQSMTYDKNHRSGKVVADARYLSNPRSYDFQGVDTGSKARKPLSVAQRAALAKGRAALASKRAAQVGGYWW